MKKNFYQRVFTTVFFVCVTTVFALGQNYEMSCTPKSLSYWTGRVDYYQKMDGAIKCGESLANEFGGWAKFDISNIPSNAVIESLILEFFVSEPSADLQDIEISQVLFDPVSADRSTLWDQILSEVVYGECLECGGNSGYNSVMLFSEAVNYFQYCVENDINWFAVGFYDLMQDDACTIDGWDWDGGTDPEPILYVTYTVSANLNEFSSNNIKHIYPNPANDYITINFASERPGSTEVLITDVTGRVVAKQLLDTNESAQINVGHLEKGIYFIRTEGSNRAIRFMKK